MGNSPSKFARVLVAAVITLIFVPSESLAAPGFIGLGDVPGGIYYSSASDISDDGRVVVGNSGPYHGDGGFRWTASGGMQPLGFIWGAYATNADGSTIIGGYQRWTAATGVVEIEGLRLPSDISPPDVQAFGVSGNGAVIVGHGGDFGGGPFRWDAPAGPAHGTPNFRATDVSFDGQTVIGSGLGAVKWRASTGIVPLGRLPNEDRSFPTSLSYDTNVIVGFSLLHPANDPVVAWRWTPTGGTVDLGGFGPSPRESLAWDVSADGAIVVGFSGQYNHRQAFIWAEHLGMLPLQDWLISNHVSGLTNWQLTEAHGISADGRSIVGQGINPDGNTEAWIVRLPTSGDTNGDGVVDGADYVAWADHFNMHSNLFADGDFNWDGVVDGADYVIWADHFAPARASMTVSAVPEPSSLLLAGLGVAALLARRMRAGNAERRRHEVLHL